MNRRTLKRLLIGWAVFLVVLLIGTQEWASLGRPSGDAFVVTTWRGVQRVSRKVQGEHEKEEPIRVADVDIVTEEITGEAPLIAAGVPFEVNLVAGRDGVKATLDGKTAYATADDLLAAQAYDRAHVMVEQGFGWGVHRPTVMRILAEQLGTTPEEVSARARLRRVRFERRGLAQSLYNRTSAAQPDARGRIEPSTLTRELVRNALKEAALHLARSCNEQGSFRYLIDANTNVQPPGYNWPRHSGTTFFLAQAAAVTGDAFIQNAALRAAGRLRSEMMRSCGSHRCITEEQVVSEVGSSALALIAFTEIVRTNADATYRKEIAELAEFLRSQQRPDGELMHFYDRARQEPIDKQVMYYSGEAALGLARAHAILQDPRDLDASSRLLGRISGAGWSFFGSRYWYSEEHWTCQAAAELWDRAPNPDAIAFCARWHEYQRRLQYGANDTPFDAEGAFGFGPLVTPRITPAASRGEAAGALLAVLLREHRTAEIPAVDLELRRSLAFVLRNQFLPGRAYLFADPVAVRGALPGSPVDWQLRIDYAQHAGSSMVRWLELEELRTAK